jgi:uncharacterized protein HemX
MMRHSSAGRVAAGAVALALTAVIGTGCASHKKAQEDADRAQAAATRAEDAARRAEDAAGRTEKAARSVEATAARIERMFEKGLRK